MYGKKQPKDFITGYRGREGYRIKEETEQLYEVKHRVGRKTPYSGKPNIKTSSDLKKEKIVRNIAMRGAKKEVKQTGKKVVFQKFGDWSKIRASAKRKIKG